MINSKQFITGRHQGGFTMVELAIVLVIAGIILAAVLKGTDMINKAKIERMTADLRGLQGMVLETEKRTGHLAGDCDANGLIGFTPPAGAVNNNSAAIAYNTVGDPDGAGRCATTATAETDANLAWSDMRKANVVDPTRNNVNLSKHGLSDFYVIGSMTPTLPAAAAQTVNTIVVYGVPLWLAKGIDVAIDGPQTEPTEELFGGARGRIRLYSTSTGIQNGGGGAAWPTDAVGTGDYQLVAFSYQFDTRMALPAL